MRFKLELVKERDFLKNVMFFCLVVMLCSIGSSLGAELNSVGMEKELAQEKKKLDSMQDIVVQNIQASQNALKNKADEEVKAVTSVQKKISPYATLKIEKFYKGCGHTTVNTMEIPKELVNMTEEELQAKYEKWEIRKFEEREIHLYREIDANCSEHFVIKEENGKVTVFTQITNKNLQFKEETDIDFGSLREEDKELIRKGVEIYGQEALSSFIEDFES